MAMLSGRMPVPYVNSVIPPGTVVNTAGTITGGTAGAGLTWILKNLAPYDYFQALLKVTAAATGAGDTMDVYIDTTFDGGTNWVNCVHFTQLLGNGGTKAEMAIVSPFSQTATAPINVAADAASGAVRHIFGDQLRIRVVTTNSAAYTFGLEIEVS